jgi:hypothetical protein
MRHHRSLLCLIVLGASHCSPIFAESSIPNSYSHSGGWHVGMALGPTVSNTQQDNNQESSQNITYTLNNRSRSTELYLG